MQTWLAEKNTPFLHQPPYSLDLAPSHFWLLNKVKMGFKSNYFDTVEDIKMNAIAELWKILKRNFFVFSNVRSGEASLP